MPNITDLLNQYTGESQSGTDNTNVNTTQNAGGSNFNPAENMLGSVLSNTLYQQLMPLLNTLNTRRITDLVRGDQYYNRPADYKYVPGDTGALPNVSTGGNNTASTTTTTTPTTTNTTPTTTNTTPTTTTTTPTTTTTTPTTTTNTNTGNNTNTNTNTPYQGPTITDAMTQLLNNIYQQEFNRSYNPLTDSYWLQQLQSGNYSINNPYKLAQDIASGAQNTPSSGANAATNDLTALGTKYITDIYQKYFGRAPDQEGLNYWLGQITSGKESLNDPNKLLQDIRSGVAANSADATALANALKTGVTPSLKDITSTAYTDPTKPKIDPVTAYLNNLYQQQFGRAPDTEGLNYWKSQFESGAESLDNPKKILQDFISGAQGADKAYYEKLPDAFKRRKGGAVRGYERTNPTYYHSGKWWS